MLYTIKSESESASLAKYVNTYKEFLFLHSCKCEHKHKYSLTNIQLERTRTAKKCELKNGIKISKVFRGPDNYKYILVV